MRRIFFTFLFFALCFLVVSCSSEVGLPVRRAAEYGEKTLEVKLPLQLKLDCANCDLEIYSWKRQEVKFEYTTSVTGKYTTESLAKKLKCFSIETQVRVREVDFVSGYTGSNKAESKIELRVYIPKKTNSIELLCKKGNLKIFDDVEGELVIQSDIFDVDINRFDGKLNCNLKEGNVRLAAGKLTDGSTIETGRGNIRVKAEYEPAGTYSFIAREGLLDIFLPKSLNAEFADDFPVGYAETEHRENESNRDAANFKLVSGIDRILINRF